MEVPMVGSDAIHWTKLKVEPQFPPSSSATPTCCPPATDSAGAFSTSSRLFIWRLHQSSPYSLELLEASLHEEVPFTGLQLVFEEPLSPFVTLFTNHVRYQEDLLHVCAITTFGIVYFIRLKSFSYHASGSKLKQSEATQLCLSSEIMRLECITAFAAGEGNLFLGGQNGSVICFSLGQDEDAAKGLSFELRDGDAKLGRLWGLLTRVKATGAIECLASRSICGSMTLFALHKDGGFKVWNMADRKRLFGCNLSSMTASIGLLAKRMWIREFDTASGFLQLAFHFCNSMENRKDAIHFYGLDLSQVDGSLSKSPLILQKVLECEQGQVMDVQLFDHSFLVLQDLGAECFRVIHGSTKREEDPQCFVMLEEMVTSQLLQGPSFDWNDLPLICRTIYPESKDTLGPELMELILSRLLQPSVFQQDVLREVLKHYKRQVHESEFYSLTRDGVRKEILAVIESESYGENEAQLISAWKCFCVDYVASWRKHNIPYALFLDSSTGAVGIIRKCSLSILRPMCGVEHLLYGRNLNEVPLGWQGERSEVEVFNSLQRCIMNISNHLGQMVLAFFHCALLGSKHITLTHLSSSFIQLLDMGYNFSILSDTNSHMGVDIERRKTKELQLRQRKFQLNLFIALEDLRDKAGGWERVVDVAFKTFEYYLHDMKKENLTSGVKECGNRNKIKKILVAGTSQVVLAHFEAARDLSLLLAFIVKFKGQLCIGASEFSRVQLQLVPCVREMLMLTRLLHWLTTTHTEQPPTEDFSLRLSYLNLVDGGDQKKTLGPTFGMAELTLAECLVSSFLNSSLASQISSSLSIFRAETVLSSVKGFIHWMVWDNESDGLLFFTERSLSLSTILLQHGQYAGLEKFLSTIEHFVCQQKLAHNPTNTIAVQSAFLHLLGFCLLAQARTSTQDTGKEEKITGAIRSFFRAASGLGERNAVLQNLFFQTGFDPMVPDSGAAAAWKVHYFEWVMQIFEQCTFKEGACLFAHAALEQVDEAVGDIGGASVGESTADSLSTGIKGRLWANIFKFALDLELFNDAYSAIISNPDSESKYICLRRFIVVLCEKKATKVLCGLKFPYVGMLERVEQELAYKAEYSDILAKPNPYKILYSFHVHRHDWRKAAYFMYRYTSRFKDEGVCKNEMQTSSCLQERLNGLLAAVNVLKLVDPLYAWFEVQSGHKISVQIRQSPTKRPRINDQEKWKTEIIDIQKMEQEYALTLAQFELLKANVKHPLLGSTLPVEDVLMLLIHAGLYAMGFSLLFLFWKDSSLQMELEKLFRVMAEKCCSDQLQNCNAKDISFVEPANNLLLLRSSAEDDGTVGFPLFVHESDVKERSSGGSQWKMLQLYLERYKSIHNRLPTIVAETILSLNRMIELPVWLVDMFKGGRHADAGGMAGFGADPAALLRIYLDFGRLSEATFLVLEYVQAWTTLRPADIIKRKQMSAVWFPYTLIDRLKHQLSENRDSDEGQHLQNLLHSPLQMHLNQAHVDSEDIASLIQERKN